MSEANKSLEIISEKLTNAYSETKAFCDSRGLVLNPGKTQLIIFKSAGKRVPDDFALTLDNHSVKPLKSVKLLGCILDQHLTLGKQIDDTVSTCNGQLAILRRAAKLLPTTLLRMMYIALTRSHLEYCSALYASATKTQLEKLDVVQRKAARIICNAPSDAHAVPLLATLNLQSLHSRREAHFMKIIDSIISCKCHPGLHSLCDRKPDGSLTVPESRTIMGRRRFGVVGAELFNKENFSLGTLVTSRVSSPRTSGGRRAGHLQLQPKANSTPQSLAGNDMVFNTECPLVIVAQPSS